MTFVMLFCVIASAAAADDWGENWGTMVWGFAIEVPTLAPTALGLLGVVIAATATRALRRHRKRN